MGDVLSDPFAALATQVATSYAATPSAAQGTFNPAPAAPAVKVIPLHLGPATTAVRAAAPAPSSAPAPAPATPSFWSQASTTEKVVIVGAGGGALWLLWLALKK